MVTGGALGGPIGHDVTGGEIKATGGPVRAQLYHAPADIGLRRVSASVGRLSPEHCPLYIQRGLMDRNGTCDTDR